MNFNVSSRGSRPVVRWALMAAAAVGMSLAGMAEGHADDAQAILKAMSDYIAKQKTISFNFDTSIEVVTPDIQKIQFDSSGKVALSRPDKFRVERTGGYSDVEVVSDGKALTFLGRDMNVFFQSDKGGTIEEIVERLRADGTAELPAADLLGTNPYEALMDGVIKADNIGLGVINGVECQHLAFRNLETDWQLWITAEGAPVPCKLVITNKSAGAAPQYTMVITDWKTDVSFSADAFSFVPPPGAKQVDKAALGNIDEVPPSTPMGETK